MLHRFLPIIMAVCLLFTSVAIADEKYYEEIPINYTSIALGMGTDLAAWWNSEESVQAAFALLVMLDICEVHPDFDFIASNEYPSLAFGVTMKDHAGVNGVAFAYLLNDEDGGAYYLATCTFDDQGIQVPNNKNGILAYRELGFCFMTLCENNWKKISMESIEGAATFLAEQFAAQSE